MSLFSTLRALGAPRSQIALLSRFLGHEWYRRPPFRTHSPFRRPLKTRRYLEEISGHTSSPLLTVRDHSSFAKRDGTNRVPMLSSLNGLRGRIRLVRYKPVLDGVLAEPPHEKQTVALPRWHCSTCRLVGTARTMAVMIVCEAGRTTIDQTPWSDIAGGTLFLWRRLP